jgi:hypothetical protein
MSSQTARETIQRALKRLGILSEEEDMTAPQAVDGLAMLNDMLQGFPAMGIQYVHAPLTLDTVLNVPDEQTRNVVLMLAEELADPYGKEIGDRMQGQIDSARRALQAAYYIVPPAQVDDALTNTLLYGTTNIERI